MPRVTRWGQGCSSVLCLVVGCMVCLQIDLGLVLPPKLHHPSSSPGRALVLPLELPLGTSGSLSCPSATLAGMWAQRPSRAWPSSSAWGTRSGCLYLPLGAAILPALLPARNEELLKDPDPLLHGDP